MALHQGAVQVTVTINGSSITINKENFMNLKIKRFIGDSANTFTLEAFDETAYALENLLMKKQDFAPITVQYCSARNMNKKVTFTGTCYGYQTSFVGKASLISISGVFSGGADSSSKYWFENANIEWVKELEFDEATQQWLIDGKGSIEGSGELYTDWISNENVVAIIKYEDEQVANTITYVDSNDNTHTTDTTTYKNSKDYLFEYTNIVSSSSVKLYGLESTKNNITIKCQQNSITELSPVVFSTLFIYRIGTFNNELPIDTYLNFESGGDLIIEEFKSYKSRGLSVDEMIHSIYKYISKRVALYWAQTDPNHHSIHFIPTETLFVDEVKRCFIDKSSTQTRSIRVASTSSETTSNKSSKFKVYYNPARIFKRIINYYAGSIGDNKTGNYSSYFKLNKVEDTQWVEGLDCRQSNETAASYINRVLCKNAMTVATDKNGSSLYGVDYSNQSAGFKYYIDGKGHNFVHIDFEANAANAPTFTYGSQDSTIISFSTGNIGSIAMTGAVYDKTTGKPNVDSATVDEFSGAVFTVGGEKVMGADVSEEEKKQALEYYNWKEYQISPTVIQSSSSSTGFNNEVQDTWERIQNYTTTAEMTVWGESGDKLAPGGFVNVIVYGNGMRHYSSGCYYITSMEDNISADGYTQTCKLIKNLSNLTPTVVKTTYELRTNSNNSLEVVIKQTYSNGSEVTTVTPYDSSLYTKVESEYDKYITTTGGYQSSLRGGGFR